MSNFTAWPTKVTYCLMLVFCFACKIDRDRNIDRSKFTFKTGDDTELFFKNVRQIYYDHTVMPGNREVFRYPERCTEDESPCIAAAIVGNFDNNEAYILIETLGLPDETHAIVVNATDSLQQVYNIVLQQRGRDLMLEFASQVYEAIEHGHKLSLELNGTAAPIFTEDEEREAFRVTMADYFRLTRIF